MSTADGSMRERLGIRRGQKNVLVVLRPLERTLTAEEANVLRDRIYAVLHRGALYAWATSEVSWS